MVVDQSKAVGKIPADTLAFLKQCPLSKRLRFCEARYRQRAKAGLDESQGKGERIVVGG